MCLSVIATLLHLARKTVIVQLVIICFCCEITCQIFYQSYKKVCLHSPLQIFPNVCTPYLLPIPQESNRFIELECQSLSRASNPIVSFKPQRIIQSFLPVAGNTTSCSTPLHLDNLVFKISSHVESNSDFLFYLFQSLYTEKMVVIVLLLTIFGT